MCFFRQALISAPLRRDRAESACHQLGVHASSFQLRKQLFNLSISNKGIAADQRDVQGLVMIDKREDSTNELLTLEVGKLTS